MMHGQQNIKSPVCLQVTVSVCYISDPNFVCIIKTQTNRTYLLYYSDSLLLAD